MTYLLQLMCAVGEASVEVQNYVTPIQVQEQEPLSGLFLNKLKLKISTTHLL